MHFPDSVENFSSANKNMAKEVYKLMKADFGDRDEIISISDGIYGGADYIPNCFHLWVKHEQEGSATLKNYVLRNVETSKVAGYRCCFIQDDGKGGLCGLKMAFRIDPNLRGQGLGKLMDQLMTEDLKRLYPEMKILKVIANFYVPEKEFNYGRVLFEQCTMAYVVNRNIFERVVSAQQKRIKIGEEELMSVPSADFFDSLKKSKVLANEYYNNFLNIDWIPYHESSFHLISLFNGANAFPICHAKQYHTGNIQFFSILTATPVPFGVRYTITIFGQDLEMTKLLLLLQIARFLPDLNGGTRVIFMVICDTAVGDDLKEFIETELQVREVFPFFAFDGPGAARSRCLELN